MLCVSSARTCQLSSRTIDPFRGAAASAHHGFDPWCSRRPEGYTEGLHVSAASSAYDLDMPSRPAPGSPSPDRDRNAEGRAESARPRDRFGRPLPRDSTDELAGKREPGEAVDSVEAALEVAVALFDARRFFEAHEFFEWIWKCDQVPAGDREFWKGVTQVAVGLTHAQRGNAKGAVTLLERACRYLDPYPSPYQGIDRDALVAVARRSVAMINAAGPSPDLDFSTFPLAARGTPR